MTPTCFQIIPNRWFQRDYPDAPAGIPRGNLLEVSVNPFNGQLVVTFQRSDDALHLVEFALDSIEDEYDSFSDFARSAIESESRYALRAVV